MPIAKNNINAEIQTAFVQPRKPQSPPGPTADNFQQILTDNMHQPPHTEKSTNQIIKLGVIDKNTPTVSNLLHQNKRFKDETWNIIFSAANRGKRFRDIRAGSEVTLNLANNEISWHRPSHKPAIPASAWSSQKLTADGLVIVGKISRETPTVSNLLRRNKIYHDEAWNIILSSINSDKPFNTIRPGTTIAINPQTFELSFIRHPRQGAAAKTISSAAEEHLSTAVTNFFTDNKSISQKLVDKIRPYIGRPYSEIDCYGLVIRGLKGLGVKYSGNGGLRETLEKMAMAQGKPLNAYQNGEGLIKAAGKTTFAKTFNHIKHPEKLAEQTFIGVEKSLRQGMILSFSTPSQGHTGVIARDNGEWSYLNSGLIDHQLDRGRTAMRVGEESLEKEIDNWFKLAKNNNEPLEINIGMLDKNKLNNFRSHHAEISHRLF
ncbi:MAG TPA: hypothetical protein ENK33_13235 [Desulfobacterales bacterium]|nr:hypothetical protein [Desulfobacterales bacterium]